MVYISLKSVQTAIIPIWRAKRKVFILLSAYEILGDSDYRNRALWLIVLAYALPSGVLGVWASVLDVNLKSALKVAQVRTFFPYSILFYA